MSVMDAISSYYSFPNVPKFLYPVPTLKSPLHHHTLGAAHCRHNVVVGGVCSELLREGDGCHLTQGGGSVPVDQVGVG